MPTNDKTCTKCGLQQPISNFNRSPSNTDGLNGSCKSCQAEYKKQYTMTPVGRANIMWSDMNRRALNRDGRHRAYSNVKITFTRQSFMDWAVPRLVLFWSNSPGSVPSIDRIDPKGDYSPSNSRIISWDTHRKLKKNAKTARDLDRARQYYERLAQQQSAQNSVLVNAMNARPPYVNPYSLVQQVRAIPGVLPPGLQLWAM